MPLKPKIQHDYATSLLYGKFAYSVRITVNGRWATKNRTAYIDPIKKWLKQNCGRQTRTLSSRDWNINANKINTSSFFLTMFLENRADYEKVLSNYKDSIVATLAPANSEHEELLLQGVKLDIRNHLYYYLYKYKVTFRGIWYKGGNNKQLIKDFVITSLHDDNKIKQDYKFLALDYILYLKTIDDLMLVKMVLGDLIREVTYAYPQDQIEPQTVIVDKTV